VTEDRGTLEPAVEDVELDAQAPDSAVAAELTAELATDETGSDANGVAEIASPETESPETESPEAESPEATSPAEPDTEAEAGLESDVETPVELEQDTARTVGRFIADGLRAAGVRFAFTVPARASSVCSRA
jgi:hypothetical protein